MNEGSPAKKTVFYVTWGAILVIGDGLCWGTADYFWTHNLIPLGDFFFWMLWLISILSASRVILETWKRPKIVWSVSILVSVIIGIGILVFSNRKPLPEPELLKPRLELYLQIGDDMVTRVLLTNSSFESTSNRLINANSIGSCLVIPILSNQPSVELQFEVFNRSKVSAEDVEVWIGVPNNWEWSVQNGWHAAFRDDSIRPAQLVRRNALSGIWMTNIMKYFAIEVPMGLKINAGTLLPPIKIATKSNLPGWLMMSVLNGFKDAPLREMETQITFQEFQRIDDLKPAYFQVQTDTNGILFFLLLDDKLKK